LNIQHTANAAANYAHMFARFQAIGGHYPCKFVECGPASIFGAWGGIRWISDSARDQNPVWDAVVAANAKAP